MFAKVLMFLFCIGLDLKNIEKCMGDPNADSDNPVLKEEQDAQVYVSDITFIIKHYCSWQSFPFNVSVILM